MKNRFFIIATFAAVMVSCVKENCETSEAGEAIRTINATWAESEAKTVLGEDGIKVLWSPKDEISVFYNEIGIKFTSLNSNPTQCTVFSSDKSLIYGRTEDASSPYLYGAYPYSEDNYQEGDAITLTVPTTQSAVEGSFARGAFPSIARSKDTNMAFYNVCGGICFTLSQSGITKIIFSGNNDEFIAGKVKVQFGDDGKPALNSVVNGEKTITLVAPDGGEFQTGKWYYISALPTALSKGFSVIFYRKLNFSESGYRSIESSIEVKRSVFGSIENIDSGVSFEYVEPASREFSIQLLNNTTKIGFDNSYISTWSSGDQILLTDGLQSAVATVGQEYDGHDICTVSVPDIFESGNMVYAAFPSSSVSDIGKGNSVMRVEIPSVQDGSASKTLFTGCSYSNTIVMDTQCGFCKVSVDQEISNISSVSFELDDYPSSSYLVNFSGILTDRMALSNIVGAYHDLSGKSNFIFSIASGSYSKITLRIKTSDGRQCTKTSEREFSIQPKRILNFGTINASSFVYPVPEAVDLGLSVKWASFNIDAAKPEEYGGYYQWAGTEDVTDKSIYLDWSNCPYHTVTSNSSVLEKYNTQSTNISFDNKTVLDPDDDVANVKLGGNWRMPTDAEWTELIDNCTWTWTNDYNGTGVAGRIVTSMKSGYTKKSIFLPATGCRYKDFFYGAGSDGCYWSSSLSTVSPYYACSVGFGLDDVDIYFADRYRGYSVRPVLE